MLKEIGSNFWISQDYFCNKIFDEEAILKSLGLDRFDSILFSTCRQAIRYCLMDIVTDRRKALIPEFTCYSVIYPFLQEGYELEFYSVDESLFVSSAYLNQLIQRHNVDVLLIHPYFGFNTLLLDEIIDSSVKVIFDRTQCQYSDFFYDFADYIVSSLRKWTNLLDGGVASKKGSFSKNNIFPVDKELEECMLAASHLKSLYMERDSGDKPSFLKLFSEGLELIRSRNSLFRMSDKSKIIQNHLDIELMTQRRRTNFLSLINFDWSRVGRPIFNVLHEGITPLYFPVYLHVERKKFQRYLADNDIYAPIIWQKSDFLNTRQLTRATERIYQHMICIPVDQRYGCADMDRVKLVVSRYGD